MVMKQDSLGPSVTTDPLQSVTIYADPYTILYHLAATVKFGIFSSKISI
jgi:hypothetical protein